MNRTNRKISFLWSRFLQTDGYSLVETLVALVLISIVLIPLTHFLASIIFNPSRTIKITAINLAEYEIEKSIYVHDFSEGHRIVSVGGKEYEIIRKTEIYNNLIYFQIIVKNRYSKRTLAWLYTIQLKN